SEPIHPEVEIELEKAPQSEEDQAAQERTVVTPRVRMPERLHRPFDVRSFATTGLFVLAIFYTIYFLRSLLLPIVLALLLSYLLRPIVRILAKASIPSLLGAGGLWLRSSVSWATAFHCSPRRRRSGLKKRPTAFSS